MINNKSTPLSQPILKKKYALVTKFQSALNLGPIQHTMKYFYQSALNFSINLTQFEKFFKVR